jgi:DNA-binding transcriptional regulator YdaS (Cro superfamily)
MDKLPSAQDRKRLAEKAGINEQFLYQCLTGRRAMEAKEAVRVEEATNYELRRWQLRPKDWFEVWPELIGTDGAPQIRRTAKQRRADERRRASLAPQAEHAEARDAPDASMWPLQAERRLEPRRDAPPGKKGER